MNTPNYVYTYDLNDYKHNKCIEKTEEDEQVCRVCYDKIDSKLIYPCKCTGSIKWIHESCLNKWIAASKKDFCPQCKYNYKKKVFYKHPKLKFLNNQACQRVLTIIFISLNIVIFSYISLKLSENTHFYIYYLYSGLKIFLILSVIILITLHVTNTVNIFEIVTNNNLNLGSNLIEFSYCIFIIYKDLLGKLISNNMTTEIKYINYKT